MPESGKFISPGEFYRVALEKGYKGTQGNLNREANSLVEKGEIKGSRRGMDQNIWYAEGISGGMI